jgi:hypothetical protein
MRHAMNLRFLAWQKFGGRSIPEGELYKLAVDYDKKKGTNTRHSGPAVTNWAKARAATGETTYKGALKEHDDIYGSNFADANNAPAITAQIAADVRDGKFTSAAEGRNSYDALNGTKFSLSSAAVIGGSSAIAAARNTTRTAVLIEGDRKKSSKVAQSGSGLQIEMSDNFRESNEEEYDIFFVPDRRVSFKEGVNELEKRLPSHNTNRTLKRLIEQIEAGTVNPTATSGLITFMLLKKGAAAPQMQIVSTAQRLPSTKPTNWDALITSSPMPIGYNSDVDGKQDGVKPSKAPRCEPTDIAETEYAAFKTTLAPWYREDKGLKVSDTVYLEYTTDNMIPMVFHSKTRMESILRQEDSKHVSQMMALISKNEISTLKEASVIVFRC